MRKKEKRRTTGLLSCESFERRPPLAGHDKTKPPSPESSINILKEEEEEGTEKKKGEHRYVPPPPPLLDGWMEDDGRCIRAFLSHRGALASFV